MITPISEEKQNNQGTIVFVRNNKPFTTARTIAKNCGLELESLRRLIKKYEKRLLKRGLLTRIEIQGKGRGKAGRDTELNEEQAYFLMTLLDNSEVVVDFKDQLTSAFFRALKEISFLKAKLASPSWQAVRLEGKEQTKKFNDTVKEFSEIAIQQGSTRKEGHYLLISKRIKQAMFSIQYKQDSFRDYLSVEQLQSVVLLESLIRNLITAGMEENAHYKEIRESIFSKIDTFAEAVGKTNVVGLTVRDQEELF